MKYQFTAEGASPSTRYHKVRILSEDCDVLYENCVSTPLSSEELEDVLNHRLTANDYARTMSARVVSTSKSGGPCIGLASICSIIANIKPLKVNITFYLDGERKFFSLDAGKLETLLKSLESE